jgi:tetratricopeptide (TPR) repeat protein
LGKYQEAINVFDEVLKINPDHKDSKLNKELALERLSKYQEVIEPQDKALKNDSALSHAKEDKNKVLTNLCSTDSKKKAKSKKKIITDDKSINDLEQKLNIKYPQVLRNKLKVQNGFYWGSFRFFCVLDKEDKQHTSDDVIRENENSSAGWNQSLPEGYYAIASENRRCLALNTLRDGKVYLYDIEDNELEIFSKTDEQLRKKLDKMAKEDLGE